MKKILKNNLEAGIIAEVNNDLYIFLWSDNMPCYTKVFQIRYMSRILYVFKSSKSLYITMAISIDLKMKKWKLFYSLFYFVIIDLYMQSGILQNSAFRKSLESV